jgi:hypothetical protein
MREAFFGDPYDMADYIRWCWLREKERADALTADKAEGKRRNAKRGPRITDADLFLPGALLVAYRRAMPARAREVMARMEKAAELHLD